VESKFSSNSNTTITSNSGTNFKGRGRIKRHEGIALNDDDDNNYMDDEQESIVPKYDIRKQHDFNDLNFDHVIEIYDFPSTRKTVDIEKLLETYYNMYKIKWVDDNHALAVFNTIEMAKEVLVKLDHPFFKVRGFNEASEKSKGLYKDLEAPAKRPTTDAVVARRMISSALNIRAPKRTPRQIEQDKLRDAQIKEMRGEKRKEKEKLQKKRL